jgi:hypothetical protein
MLLLLLKDGSHIEVAQASDVIHKLGFLVCVDEVNEPLITFPVNEVMAYTRNDKLAGEFVSADAEPRTHGRQPPPPKRASRRKGHRSSRDEHSPVAPISE